MNLFLISVFICLIILYSLWYFVFNIYEVKFEIVNAEIKNSKENIFEIKSIPINLLGYKVPFRKPDFDFEIKEGGALISIVPRKHNNELYFGTSQINGKVIFKLKTELSLFPEILEFDFASGN